MDGARSYHARATLRPTLRLRPFLKNWADYVQNAKQRAQAAGRPLRAPYSPELNPAENMWNDMREKFFHNLSFNFMESVERRGFAKFLAKFIKTSYPQRPKAR